MEPPSYSQAQASIDLELLNAVPALERITSKHPGYETAVGRFSAQQRVAILSDIALMRSVIEVCPREGLNAAWLADANEARLPDQSAPDEELLSSFERHVTLSLAGVQAGLKKMVEQANEEIAAKRPLPWWKKLFRWLGS